MTLWPLGLHRVGIDPTTFSSVHYCACNAAPLLFLLSLLPGWPDWATFRQWGDCFMWAVFRKSQKWRKFFSTVPAMYSFRRITCWAKAWATFRKRIWSPCSHRSRRSSRDFSLLRIRVARWYFFKPKISIWENVGGLLNLKSWYIIWPFGIYYCHLVYCMAIW
jgi:hypothetical protein